MISRQIHWQNILSVCIFISRSKVKILVSMFCIPHPGVYFSGLCVVYLLDCSNGAVRGQIVSNPYARDTPSRNPYEDHSPSADHHSDYRPRAPSHTYDDLVWFKNIFNISVSENIDIYEFICVCPLGYYGTVYST